MGDVLEAEEAGRVPAGPADDHAALDAVLWDPIAAGVLVRSQPRFDEVVLDAGCGDGATALPTAELVGPGGRVDAFDPDEALVALVRDRAGDRMPQLRPSVGDPTDREAADAAEGGYDLVQCTLGVRRLAAGDLDRVGGVVQRLVAQARPGGRVAIAVWAGGSFDPLPEILAGALAPEYGGAADASELAESANPTLPGAETPGAFARLLSGYGLIGVRSALVPLHLELDEELAWRLVTGTTLRTLIDVLDDDAVERVRTRALAAIADRSIASVDASVLVAVGRRPV
ncbi:class I SAM-dependent methyltransferase [Agromyces larvae]|uniref:Methyltransferase domain-containing protein n=1 Tax=Agromyces larvae TaxID=2929802 RepID=A0ABY4BW31_9MICO|nr:class I SAM-dependent methyltransferase [Agromyces larvae]UOE42959.1 methyltransferase domain-containing protein [Agromyces larvae]